MRCNNCGARIKSETVFCSECGYSLLRNDSDHPGTSAGRGDEGGRRWIWLSTLVVITFVMLLAVIGVGALGAYQGLQERERRQTETIQAYYQRSLTHIEQGNYRLALAELQEVVKLAPDHAEAQNKLREVRKLVEGGTPTPTLPPREKAAEERLQEALASYDQGRWEEAATQLEELRQQMPSYKAAEVENLLFSCYYNRGTQLVEADQLAAAVEWFDRALTLQPENPNALGQKRLATLYLAGSEHWEDDWELAIEKFGALYRIKPDYKDVRKRLRDAHLKHGDEYAEEAAWCLAQKQYERAMEVSPNPVGQGKRDEATEKCHQAVTDPTPTLAPGGSADRPFVAGIVEILDIPPDRMHIRGQILDANREPMPGVEVKIYAWDWSAFATSNAEGWYSFDGLANPVTYTLTLTQFPTEPIDVPADWGKQPMVNFVEQP